MKIRKLTGIVCGGMVTLAVSALAAPEDTPSPASSSQPLNRSTTYGRSATTSSHVQSSQAIRASQLIGSTVRSPDGKILGQVRDIVVEPQSGRIDFAVLSPSGGSDSATESTSTTSTPSTTILPSTTSYNASVGGKLVPVPWQLFSQNFAGTGGFASSSSATSSTLGSGTMGGTMSLSLNLDEAKLRAAPSIDVNNWSGLQQNGFGQRAYSHYGLNWNSRMSGTGTPGSGISTGVGTSSSDRNDNGVGTQPLTEPKSQTDTSPDRGTSSGVKGSGTTTPPQPK